MIKKVCLGLCLLLPSATWAAQEKPTITWLEYDLPPGYIAHGPMRDSGFSDLTTNWLYPRLRNYNHKVRQGTTSRLLRLAKSGALVCSSVLKNPEREQFLYFSDPTQLLATHKLYFLAKQKAYLQQLTGQTLNRAVSLNKVFNALPELKFAIANGRSYGSERDKIVARYNDKMKVFTRQEQSSHLIKNLLAERLDMIIEYPWIMKYETQRMQGDFPSLASVDIVESSPAIKARIACSKTPQGYEVIKIINALIYNAPRQQLQQYADRWTK
ncbi:hypothetical protein [Motilimonas pumila]|uniref:hypothetical protein n=1 Tax=Motilimonas pumila TaxID=2303987 RepID=UPI0011C418E4|nr:hypothetical protein [Motilimonas pumila]